MSKPVKQRAAYKANVTKEVENLKSLFSQNAEIDKFRAILAKFSAYKQKIENLSETILSELTDEAAIDKEIADFAAYDDWFLDLLSNISIHIDKLSASKPVSSKSEPDKDALPSTSSRVKLPKLQITKFGGDPMKYREFWDSFMNTIDKNAELADIDKFKYLKGYLEGDALRLCEGYSLTSENYEAVKAVITQRFGNPQLAIFSHLTALIEQTPASHSVKELQKIFDECEKHVRSLVGLGLQEDQYGLVFTPIILSKLPLHVKMELHRQNGSEPWTLARLRELLRQEIHARDMSERQFVQSQNGKAPDAKQKSGDQARGKSPGFRPFSGSQLGFAGKRGPFQPRPCAFCGGAGHKPDQCTVFPDHQARRQKLGSGCVRCLSNNHAAQACQSKSSCAHCKKKNHHSSLCFSLFPAGAGPGPQGKKPNSALDPKAPGFVPATHNAVHGTGSTDVTNMQTAVASCAGSDIDSTASLRLLFDTAGFRSYITSSAAKLIYAKKVGQETMSLGVFEEKRRRTRTYDVVEFFVHVRNGDPVLIKANVTDFITCPVYCPPLDLSVHPILAQTQLAEPTADKPRNLPIDVLIGGDQYYDFITSDQVRLSNGLILLSSKLGYITAGTSAFAQLSIPGQTLLSTSFPSATDKDLNLERFWRLEDIGIKDECPSPADECALQQVSSSRKMENGRYFVKFPRRDNASELPENRELAFGRLRSLFRKLSSNPSMLQRYHEIILDQVNRGIIEESPVVPTGQVHYLPHHCVLKPDSLTTPVRVVHDASSKIRKSVPSLNDTLYCGPLFLADLVGLLCRFRLNDVAIISDIEKAFLNIGLQESERDLVRFFWVQDPNKPPSDDNLITYRFCRVPFGLVCSSFLLAACVLHHLSLYLQPAAKLMADNLYVDNIVVTFSDVEEAKGYYTTAKQILAEASLNLRQWFTNSLELRQAIPKEDVGKGGNVTKVLGMVWDTVTDTLKCPSINVDASAVFTKRQLLQFVAKMFDPCGLFSPVAVMGKLLVQRAWEQKLQWDDPLPIDFRREWIKVGESIKAISGHCLPRKLGSSIADSFSLHCFCDASMKCYAAAIFLKCGSGSEPHLLFSKTKLAPLKGSKSAPKSGLTVPQLELMAVVVGCRVLRFVAAELQLPNCEHYIWSDSQCVLHWVSQRGVATAFVRGRVKEIRDIATKYNVLFRYVRSEDNPADYASRGSLLAPLIANRNWWHGPAWLKNDADTWPESPVPVKIGSVEMPVDLKLAGVLPSDHHSSIAGVLPSDHYSSVAGAQASDHHSSIAGVLPRGHYSSIAGVLPCDNNFSTASVLSCGRPFSGSWPACQSTVAGQPLEPQLPASILDLLKYERFSSLRKIVRTLSYVRRFVSNCRAVTNRRSSGPLSSQEISSANDALIRDVQRKHYASFFSRSLSAKMEHLVRQLGIWKDDSEVLRCQTRLSFSDAEASATFPILLPAKDHYTDLVIIETHDRLFHAGAAHCLAELRQRYWIPRARPRIKTVLRNCKLCQRLKAVRFRYPDPPPLPDFRANRQQVFETTGLDYLGPLTIRSPDGDKKVWIVIFTCAVVRAIHLEVVEDMTTEQFLLAFRRLGALYGCPVRLVSDNAKQFKTANLTFKRACDDGSLAQTAGSRGVQWKFIPEHAPWFGGFYERLVTSVKRCLRSALHFARVTLAELRTLSYEIAACLNTRPLTYIESELESVSLCPANFLLKGRPVNLLEPSDLGADEEWRPTSGGLEGSLVLSWRRNQALLNKFWNMWQRAYLTGLKENERHLKQRNVLSLEPELGMTVLVSDKTPKGQWKLARIVALHKSFDGVVRSAEVQLANGSKLRRALKLLCPLETTFSDPENKANTDPPQMLQPDSQGNFRPKRQAAVRAQSKIRDMLNDESSVEPEISNSQSVLCCVFSNCDNIDTNFWVSEMPSKIYIGTGHRLSRSYVHRPAFFVGPKCFTSVLMATSYIQMAQDDKTELADEMHMVPRLRNVPQEIPRWLADHGYAPSATVVFNAPEIMKNIFLCQLEAGGPLHEAIQEFYEAMVCKSAPVVACGKGYVYECGIRLEKALTMPFDKLPGFNLYGDVLTSVLSAYSRNDITPNLYTEILATVPGFIPPIAAKTVLVLSDSICRSIESIEGGTIRYQSGATFEDLIRILQDEHIRFAPYARVIIHCGINDIQKGRLPAQVMWLQMLDYLQTVEIGNREYPPEQILLSCPLLHPEIPPALEYSFLIKSHCDQRGIKALNWGSGELINPFIDSFYWRERTSATDGFHVNHAGVTELWNAWSRIFPELRTVTYSLKQDPVRQPRRHSRR